MQRMSPAFRREGAATHGYARGSVERQRSVPPSSGIAVDPQACGPARVFAFRTLVYQGYPGAVSTYAQITLQTPNVECIGGGSGFDFEAREGSPLPADAFQQVVALTDRVRSEKGLPPRVARAAVCAWQASLRKLPR